MGATQRLPFSESDVYIIALHDGQSASVIKRLIPSPYVMTSSDADRGAIELSAETGELFQLDGRTGEVIASHAGCNGEPSTAITRVLHRSLIAYACRDGTIGLWSIAGGTTNILTKTDARPYRLVESDDGCCLYIGTASGEVVSYSFDTQRETIYSGHAGRVLVLHAPSSTFPYLLTGDQLGYLRVRRPLPTDSHSIFQGTPSWSKVYGIKLDNSIVFNGTLAGRYRSGHLELMQPHSASHTEMAFDPTGPRIALFGRDREIEIWSLGERPMLQTLRTDKAVLEVGFTPDGGSLLVGHLDDSAIDLWSIVGGTHRSVATIDYNPLAMRECDVARRVAIISDRRDWIYVGGKIQPLGPPEPYRHAAICSPDGAWLVEGLPSGAVQLKSTVTGWSFPVYRGREPARWFAAAADGSELAIAADGKVIVQGMPGGHGRGSANVDQSWQTRIAGIRYVSYSPDGAWLAAACDNGDVWFYRRRDGRWLYRSAGTIRIVSCAFSPDSTQFVTVDTSGRILLFDMTASAFHDVQ